MTNTTPSPGTTIHNAVEAMRQTQQASFQRGLDQGLEQGLKEAAERVLQACENDLQQRAMIVPLLRQALGEERVPGVDEVDEVIFVDSRYSGSSNDREEEAEATTVTATATVTSIAPIHQHAEVRPLVVTYSDRQDALDETKASSRSFSTSNRLLDDLSSSDDESFKEELKDPVCRGTRKPPPVYATADTQPAINNNNNNSTSTSTSVSIHRPPSSTVFRQLQTEEKTAECDTSYSNSSYGKAAFIAMDNIAGVGETLEDPTVLDHRKPPPAYSAAKESASNSQRRNESTTHDAMKHSVPNESSTRLNQVATITEPTIPNASTRNAPPNSKKGWFDPTLHRIMHPMRDIQEAPYSENESAEVGEACFKMLQNILVPPQQEQEKRSRRGFQVSTEAKELFSSEQLARDVLGTYAAIRDSGIVFSPDWMTGRFARGQCGQLTKPMLLLLLQPHRFPTRTTNVLRKLAQELEVCTLFCDAMFHWYQAKEFEADDFPLFHANANSSRKEYLSIFFTLFKGNLRKVKKSHWLCIIFVARVYQCLITLKQPKLEGLLRTKVRQCLTILYEEASQANPVAPNRHPIPMQAAAAALPPSQESYALPSYDNGDPSVPPVEKPTVLECKDSSDTFSCNDNSGKAASIPPHEMDSPPYTPASQKSTLHERITPAYDVNEELQVSTKAAAKQIPSNIRLSLNTRVSQSSLSPSSIGHRTSCDEVAVKANQSFSWPWKANALSSPNRQMIHEKEFGPSTADPAALGRHTMKRKLSPAPQTLAVSTRNVADEDAAVL